jgi:hypothetical protein
MASHGSGVDDDTMLKPLSAKPSRAGLRRVSSQSAKRADLFGGMTVVGPADRLDSQSAAGDMALAFEMAKHHLSETATSTSVTPTESMPTTPDESSLTTTDKYAFAFDIDGVLIKGGKVIPEAIEAMKVLNGENQYGIKV